MVFHPRMHNADYGLVEYDHSVPVVLEPDSPMSALVVVVHDWVGPVTATQ